VGSDTRSVDEPLCTLVRCPPDLATRIHAHIISALIPQLHAILARQSLSDDQHKVNKSVRGLCCAENDPISSRFYPHRICEQISTAGRGDTPRGTPRQTVAELSPGAAGYTAVPLTSVQICHSRVVSQSYGHYLQCKLSRKCVSHEIPFCFFIRFVK